MRLFSCFTGRGSMLRRLIAIVIVVQASCLPVSTPACAGTVEESRGERLMRFFAEEFKPERARMIIENEPNDDGLVREIYLDVEGCDIGGVRIESLILRAIGVTFTPPSEWDETPLDVVEMLNVNATARITDRDLNENLLQKQFGDDDEWHNLQMRITPEGVYACGNYHVRVLFTLDILIEIFSKFKIVDMQQVWLDDYTLRVNRVDVPSFITDKAVSQIQPLLDLGKFIFPLRLSSIAFEDGSMTIASRVEPEPFEGIEYEYEKETAPDDEEEDNEEE